MNKLYLTLIERIEDEVADLERIVNRVEQGWKMKANLKEIPGIVIY